MQHLWPDKPLDVWKSIYGQKAPGFGLAAKTPVSPMVSKKGQPALGPVGISRRSFHPTRDGSFGEVKPSMRSSPWIRGAPQVGFSATIWKINSRISFGVCFLPTCLWTLEISLQYIRKPARCQRTTVSGVTTRRACFHPDHTRRAISRRDYREARDSGEDVDASA